MLDFFGVALGGSAEAGVAEMRDLVLEWGGAPQSSILRWGDKVPAPNAAQVNATMAHSLDFDDVHEDAIMHPGVVAIPTALAMSEYVGGVSGQEFIAAVALGTDFICRLGLATRPGESIHQYGWHLTTLFGYMTAAAVAARLLGLDETGHHQRHRHRLPPVFGQRPMRQGRGPHQAHGSRAWRCGVASPRPSWPSGASPARATAWKARPESISVYHGHSTRARPWSASWARASRASTCPSSPTPAAGACTPSSTPALTLVAEHDIRPEDVESIVIYCGEGTYGLLGSPLEVKARPRNFVDSQFSLAWGVATAIARRRAALDDFTPEAIKSPDILAVSAKIDVRNDHALDRGDVGHRARPGERSP